MKLNSYNNCFISISIYKTNIELYLNVIVIILKVYYALCTYIRRYFTLNEKSMLN